MILQRFTIDFDVDIYHVDSMKELAEQFVDEGLFGDIPDHLANYIDMDAIAYDLAMDYTETEVAGERLIYRGGLIARFPTAVEKMENATQNLDAHSTLSASAPSNCFKSSYSLSIWVVLVWKQNCWIDGVILGVIPVRIIG